MTGTAKLGCAKEKKNKRMNYLFVLPDRSANQNGRKDDEE